MTSSVSQIVGVLAGSETVKQAALGVLSTPPAASTKPLIVYYLAEVERQAGLSPGTIPVPPAPDSFYGGVDFESWEQVLLPSIVVVADPVDAPDRFGDGTVGQWYEVQIGSIVTGDTEDAAQDLAAYYGTAVMGAILQNGDLGGVANQTEVTTAAKVELVEDATRAFARSVLTVRTYLDQIVSTYDGPAAPVSWPSDPYTPPADAPTVETVTIDVELMDRTADLDDATFTGDDVIVVTEP